MGLAASVCISCNGSGGKQNQETAGEWKSLFNGKDLSGWTVKGRPEDVAKDFWKVRDGVITANSMDSEEHDYVWLVSDGEFDDFVIKLEFQAFRGNTGNSGLQIRSRYDDDSLWLDGPQVDIHPPGSWRTGMMWDETRGARRFLYPEIPEGEWVDSAMAPPGMKFYYSDDDPAWNQMEVTAVGTHIRVVLNGMELADFDGEGILNDAVHQKYRVGMKGHIALQIHRDSRIRIRFRNIRIREL